MKNKQFYILIQSFNPVTISIVPLDSNKRERERNKIKILNVVFSHVGWLYLNTIRKFSLCALRIPVKTSTLENQMQTKKNNLKSFACVTDSSKINVYT